MFATFARPFAPLRARRRAALVVGVLVAIAMGLVGVVPRALAQGGELVRPVNADVMLMLATQTDGGAYVDPLIGTMPQLGKPPFSAYNNYRLLDRKVLVLEKGKGANYTLVNSRILQVSYMEQMPDKRFHISAAINQPGGKTYLKLLEVKAAPNEPFFVAGQPFKGGSLVLAITIRP